ncbi:type II toxin-antitoxin system RelB/DinJ family antitoxin [Acinetobacter nectaris]|uniref:type II toxin-antitoxin system RelB/DinJ family antitoxin n=1 Tax=Acinetobacter nectaris TaxID=1219382 RepID=UPI001F029A2D|nr:type II toxin-antitoxin system RelB/DinJ family antitoxin [Acinetobacter nectaris]MCF8998126.1 type II toxin-antitoxin system RelB/DinJ family antitoxin [Acinetobacter nectaris]MCF9026948.1 type II toxin-antitoxin system RelB/DinJ family antitoxin [Acinetobacter nectaris]
MRKTEVYQVRLDSQEKKQAFAVFKHLGITPAQAVRLFFKQVVLTKSIPFSIENQNINMEQLLKLKKTKASTQNDDNHDDFFDELTALLNESNNDQMPKT